MVEMSSAERSEARQAGGEINAAVARAVVRLWTQHLGRGPTKAYAFARGNVVVAIMEETLTRPEQSLVAGGRAEAVHAWRREVHNMMRAELKATVQSLTGRRVIAALGDWSIDPDVATEVFVLGGPAGPTPDDGVRARSVGAPTYQP
jgi:uncharacterized protein YbcI